MSVLNAEMFPFLSADVFETLRRAGYISALDLVVAEPESVARQCNLRTKDIVALRRAVLRLQQVTMTRSDEIYREMRLYTAVFPTGVESLDRILRGGIFSGEIVELVGPIASGKTQICFSVAAYTTVVAKQRVLYVDTNGSFSAARVKGIMESHGITDKELQLALSRISWCPCFEVQTIFILLDEYAANPSDKREDGQPVKLIIVDSIATLILPLLGGSNMEGLGLLNRLCTKLKSFAVENQIAVLVTNSVIRWQNEKPRPSLGQYWSHVPNVRISLSAAVESEGNRLATVIVSKTVAFGTQAKYRLTSTGVEAGQPE